MSSTITGRRTPVWAKALAVLGAVVVVAGGAYLVSANVNTGGMAAMAAGAGWWIAASALIGVTALRRRPDLRKPVWSALAVTAVALLAVGFVMSRGNTVDEDIVTGVPAPPARDAAAAPAPRRNIRILSGSFSGKSGHDGEGEAAVVRLRDGRRVLTFSRFDVDPGAARLRIYLHAGATSSDDLGDFVELASLKGTRGDQQYELPRDLSLERYSSVVIWCVPFSTRIAEAPLA